MISTQEQIIKKITEEKLPTSYADIVNTWLKPIVKTLALTANAPKWSKKNKSLIFGVQGTQGSGKSTSSDFIKLLLENEYNLSTVVLSIDDFYLTANQRKELSQTIHPLLQTRGVPGTHDIELAIQTINQLSDLDAHQSMAIPRFEKAIDDRAPKDQWPEVHGPVDVIILEGWCIGLKPETVDSLTNPVNELESKEDKDGKWRSFANESLNSKYQQLFSMIDKQLVLNAPSFDCVYQWRLTQEHKLIERIQQSGASNNVKTLTDEGVKRFISHYQRLTEHALRTMPKQADWCLWLTADQKIEKLTEKLPAAMEMTSSLIVTDLDGTLLDHHTYSWQAAKQVIEKLKSNQVPIIINTSKTFDEVITLQKNIGINMPFIVENGSALYLPKSFVSERKLKLLNASETTEHFQILFGENRSTIIDIVYSLKQKYKFSFSGYNEWSIEDIIERTGLTFESATASINRKYSEPIVWEDTETALEDFKSKLSDNHLTTLKGGRFLHILGITDKAKPVIYLEHILSTASQKKLNIICLGDSYNDSEMLSVADIPVWVKSPTHNFPPHKGENTPYYTKSYGPEGWHEAMQYIFSGQI